MTQAEYLYGMFLREEKAGYIGSFLSWLTTGKEAYPLNEAEEIVQEMDDNFVFGPNRSN